MGFQIIFKQVNFQPHPTTLTFLYLSLQFPPSPALQFPAATSVPPVNTCLFSPTSQLIYGDMPSNFSQSRSPLSVQNLNPHLNSTQITSFGNGFPQPVQMISNISQIQNSSALVTNKASNNNVPLVYQQMSNNFQCVGPLSSNNSSLNLNASGNVIKPTSKTTKIKKKKVTFH